MTKQVVFFGSSEFSVIVLEKVLSAKCPVLSVVTTPDKPMGRHLKLTPNPVKLLAQEHRIPVATTMNYELLTNNSRPVGLVAAYGKIIPQSAIDAFGGQICNIHPSLLPKYRGPSPLQQQILDGITETGVTIIQLDSEVDHGPIIAQEKEKITSDDTTVTLGVKLFAKGADLFLQLLNNSPLPFPSLSQREGPEVSYTKKLTRQDGFLEFEEFKNYLKIENLKLKIDRLWRAYYPWPGVWTTTPEGQRLKLIALQPQIFVQLEGKTPQSWPIVV
ncbi:MAG: methionyl-tRNA formyltransferase [Patescibacteria group bacterium]